MRVARFAHDGAVSYGLVLPAQGGNGSGGRSAEVADPQGDHLVVAQLVGHPFGPKNEDVKLTGVNFALADVRLLAPILPSKVVCADQNYADRAREMGNEPPAEPVIFLKPSTAVCGPGDPIMRPTRVSHRVDYEGELAVVIGRLCRDVPPERVDEVIFGYTCANDVTARDLQAKDGQWTRAKGFDTFCPLGPWIETDLESANRESTDGESTDVESTGLALTTRLNGEVVQQASTSALVHDVRSLVVFVTSVMTLLPGDVLLTGTPAGAGALEKGDEVSVTVDGIGTLANPVTDRD